ncbi:D-aminoacylase [Gimesia sp.]|uniref:N-acyl-D-amino-acid deacylase family protein n=1 Tax=Gimesia sp. TaxID=2024833 RepID=UPI000C3D2C7E|nr:D-aminoacylase [Gimesia sp.]MAX37494.1 N-acyl-D-amino acid deacylase [Gimesia sp.]HBL48020.1 N-acyl-D-amino acid deacylase [Planctomycetaceae bacterium]|tara:strand:- start:24355 stop:25971 length:1617 start_codon:yes stop_codon:yes gene_type:complete
MDCLRLQIYLCLLFFAFFPSDSLYAQNQTSFDILLKGGTIIDGTGKPGFTGDIAIKYDRIVQIGPEIKGTASETIPCRGLTIAPGFIDLHNHSDRQIISPLTRANMNYVTQGCTTIVTGNCGSGPVDTEEYYRIIDAAGSGTNVLHLIPQGSLRDEVMGSGQRKPTDEELQKMKSLAEKAMQDGAWGMSTGLIYVPSSYAETDELVELAQIVSRYQGIYASHIRNESTELLAAVNEALKIGKQAKLPVHISHFKSSGQDAWGLVIRAAAMIEDARKQGQNVTADQYPYIASSTSLGATLIPAWARAGSNKELVARLEAPETSEKIRKAIQSNIEKREEGKAVRIARYSERPDWVGKNLLQIAEKENKSVLDIVLEITRQGGASVVNFSMNEADVRQIMKIDWVATASDGRAYLPGSDRPHPRNYGTFPRKLAYYALQQKVIPLEHAVRSMTGLPADILGLKDRGYLREGAYADIVVMDTDTLIDKATFDDPHQYSDGIRFLYVNGSPAITAGFPTGSLAGKALRHQTVANNTKKQSSP